LNGASTVGEADELPLTPAFICRSSGLRHLTSASSGG
jgi:hypothetical protein